MAKAKKSGSTKISDEESVKPPVVDTDTNIDQPPVVEDVPEPPVDDTDTNIDQPPVVEDVPEPKAKKADPHHISFFNQYVEMMRLNNPKAAIKAANNSIKSMLASNNPESFDTILNMFKESRMVLTQKVRLQEAATLPMSERATLEIVSTIYHALVNDPKMPINLEYARSIIKNDAFINWVAKKLAK